MGVGGHLGDWSKKHELSSRGQTGRHLGILQLVLIENWEKHEMQVNMAKATSDPREFSVKLMELKFQDPTLEWALVPNFIIIICLF